MEKSLTEKAAEYFEKVLNDPEEWKKFEAAVDQIVVEEENKLICAVACEDPRYRQATAGDMVAYAMNPLYYVELEHRAMDLFYQFHGNGD